MQKGADFVLLGEGEQSLLELINAMLYGTNFPEGFRAGMSLRGFNLGASRQLLSPSERTVYEEIRSRIAGIVTWTVAVSTAIFR